MGFAACVQKGRKRRCVVRFFSLIKILGKKWLKATYNLLFKLLLLENLTKCQVGEKKLGRGFPYKSYQQPQGWMELPASLSGYLLGARKNLQGDCDCGLLAPNIPPCTTMRVIATHYGVRRPGPWYWHLNCHAEGLMTLDLFRGGMNITQK